MKYPLVLFFLFVLINKSAAQDTDFFEANIKLFSANISYEKKISDEFFIRASLGYDAKYYFNNNIFTGETKDFYILQPVLSVQPRYYYNLKKRESKNLKTTNNSANFLAFDIAYKSSLGNISNEDVHYYDSFAFSPIWSIRRNISDSKFVYEAGVGLSLSYYLKSNTNQRTDLSPKFNVGIGYVF